MEKFKSPERLLAFLSKVDKSFTKAPVDLYKICALYDIAVEEQDYFSEPTLGKIYIKNQKATIVINSYENTLEQRKRFTIAHELGHFFLHLNAEQSSFIDNQQTMSRTESYWHPIEAQANDFAARLLMPLELIIKEAEELVKDEDIEEENFITELANTFKVSKIAMTYRLKNIGII